MCASGVASHLDPPPVRGPGSGSSSKACCPGGYTREAQHCVRLGVHHSQPHAHANNSSSTRYCWRLGVHVIRHTRCCCALRAQRQLLGWRGSVWHMQCAQQPCMYAAAPSPQPLHPPPPPPPPTHTPAASTLPTRHSPVLVQAPQAHAENLEHKERRQHLLLEQGQELRDRHLKLVETPGVYGC